MKKLIISFLMVATLVVSSVSWAFASPVGGTKTGFYRLPGLYKQTFTQKFYAGEYARVTIEGDGDTDLDLYVYDQYGRLVACDDTYADDDGSVEFYVPYNSRTAKPTYSIVVVNRGRIFNDYRIWLE